MYICDFVVGYAKLVRKNPYSGIFYAVNRFWSSKLSSVGNKFTATDTKYHD